MGLDITDRGALEKIIEARIQEIPKLLQIFRTEEIKSRLQISYPEEFCYGNMHGRIFGEFTVYYFSTHKITMPDDDVKELGEILEKRSREIKDAIFNCG